MKVVIPAAGLGTRFLPITKSMPKEMLPVLDRPVIQYVIEEAVASGGDDITIITGRTKRAIEDYFDHSPEHAKEDRPELAELDRLSQAASIFLVRQRSPMGLANAIQYAEKHIGNEPFGVLLGDTINVCRPPLLKQLEKRFHELGGRSSIVAVEQVEASKVKDYGIIEGVAHGPGLYEAERFLEKPDPRETSSRLGITGAYFLTSSIFDAIRQTAPGQRGEIQLTDALTALSTTEKVYATTFAGKRYDIGDRFIWLRTNIEFALKDSDLGPRLRTYLAGVTES